MAKRIKLKAHVKPPCNHDHYLELCQSFDGETYTYRRYCCECGRWWTHSEHVEQEQEFIETTHYVPWGQPISKVYSYCYTAKTGQAILFADNHVQKNIMYRDIYTLNADGTVGDFIRREDTHGNIITR